MNFPEFTTVTDTVNARELCSKPLWWDNALNNDCVLKVAFPGGHFRFFFCSGEGKGGARRREGGGRALYEKSQEGDLPGRWGEGAGVCWEFGAGGRAKYFYSGPKFPPSFALI